MSPQLKFALQRLEEANWFTHVGEPTTIKDAVQVKSCKQAEEYFTSEDWQDTTLEAANRLSAACMRLHPKWSAKRWDELVTKIKDFTEPLIEGKITRLMREQDFTQVLEDWVKWDILAYCKEQEFSGELASGFFSRLGDIYIAGHYPCGWIGKYPLGELVIF